MAMAIARGWSSAVCTDDPMLIVIQPLPFLMEAVARGGRGKITIVTTLKRKQEKSGKLLQQEQQTKQEL